MTMMISMMMIIIPSWILLCEHLFSFVSGLAALLGFSRVKKYVKNCCNKLLSNGSLA